MIFFTSATSFKTPRYLHNSHPIEQLVSYWKQGGSTNILDSKASTKEHQSHLLKKGQGQSLLKGNTVVHYK